MKKLACLLLTAGVIGCTTTTPPPRPTASTPPRPTNALTAIATSPVSIAQPSIRVGLMNDQSTIAFPRTSAGYIVTTESGPSIIKRGFRIDAPLRGGAVKYAIQVAALFDQTSADALVERLKKDTGLRVDSNFDVATTTHKVLVGEFPESSAANPTREQLIALGYPRESMIVPRPAEQKFEKTLLLVDDEGDQSSFSTDTILILPVEGETMLIGDQKYRGGAQLFINSRGLLNVINELYLEDYVRGVVPNEMGPRVFDELEAIKAQALAARTYAVKRLGEYRAEGYDICATPACQVYKGFSTEDPMSDQAVKETAGMVITHNGTPIDAMFTSTCGGRTSDVGVMFPGRAEPYLVGRSCVELDMRSLNGRAESGLLNDMEVDSRAMQSLLGAEAANLTRAWSSREIVAAVTAAAKVHGTRLRAAKAPASSRRRDVLAYLDEALGLAEAADVLILPEDVKYFYPNSATDAQRYASAAFLVKYRIIPTQHIDRIDLDAVMPRDELLALLYSWNRKTELVSDTTGRIMGVSGNTVTIKTEGRRNEIAIPAGVPIFRKLNERYQEYKSVPVTIGDRITISRMRNRIVAAVVQANYDGAAFDRTSSFSSWVRSYRADDLVTSIARRNPIKTLVDIRPLSVDPAHRVKELEIEAEGGRKFVLRGLPIRWSINTPDNLFVMFKSTDPDGMARYTFFGKGWGHGVGMCQNGAFGMAVRGRTADQIIRHYYAGTEIRPMKP